MKNRDYYQCATDDLVIIKNGTQFYVENGTAYSLKGEQMNDLDVDYVIKSDDFIKIEEPEGIKAKRKAKEKGKFIILNKIGECYHSIDEAKKVAEALGNDCHIAELKGEVKIIKKVKFIQV